MRGSDWRDLFTWEIALQVAYWVFWIAVFSLAINELIYLLQGYSDFSKSIPAGASMAAGKYYVGTLNTREADLRQQLQGYRKFTRNALMWSGPQVVQVSELRELDEGLAFGVVVEASVGFDEYNSEPRSDYLLNLVRDLLPSDVYGYLGHVKQLERIDRYMKYVAERIVQIEQDNPLHDIRTIVLREVFEVTSGDKNVSEALFGDALDQLRIRAKHTPPMYAFLQAVKMEYTGHDSRGVAIGSWGQVESWFASRQPRTFDDLLGTTGLPLPSVPETPKGRTYYS